MLSNLGQLYRYELAAAYGHLPNPDGTFNNRRLDRFLAEADPGYEAFLVQAAKGLGGFVMLRATEDGGHTVADFFVVRTLRRTGVGRQAARQAIARHGGPWRIGFQRYNDGVEQFWSQVATDLVGHRWETYDDPPVAGRPPDTWITFRL